LEASSRGCGSVASEERSGSVAAFSSANAVNGGYPGASQVQNSVTWEKIVAHSWCKKVCKPSDKQLRVIELL
jgi:hypothetical protein